MHLSFYPRYQINTFLQSPQVGEPGLHSQFSEWTVGWMTEESWFNYQQGQQIFFLFSKKSQLVLGLTDASFSTGKMARA